MSNPLTLDVIRNALTSRAAAFRRCTPFQPTGGPGDKVVPPTYEGGKYATETRHIDRREVPCVLMDSVQSQANRMEQALLDAHRDGLIELPLVTTRFDHADLEKRFTVKSLDAPHRVADALFRDNLLDGVMFRQSEKGRILDYADPRNATGLFGLNPVALVFGLWDSTGPRGGLGTKFQRALVSEMVGLDAVAGVKTSSRIDPAQIMLGAGPLHHRKVSLSSPAMHRDRRNTRGRARRQVQRGTGGMAPAITAGQVSPMPASSADDAPLRAGRTHHAHKFARLVYACVRLGACQPGH